MKLPSPITDIHFRVVRCGSTGLSAAPEYYSTPIPVNTNLYGVLFCFFWLFLCSRKKKKSVLDRINYKKKNKNEVYRSDLIICVVDESFRLLSVAFVCNYKTDLNARSTSTPLLGPFSTLFLPLSLFSLTLSPGQPTPWTSFTFYFPFILSFLSRILGFLRLHSISFTTFFPFFFELITSGVHNPSRWPI